MYVRSTKYIHLLHVHVIYGPGHAQMRGILKKNVSSLTGSPTGVQRVPRGKVGGQGGGAGLVSTTRRPRNQYPPPPGACTLPMVPSAQILLLYPRKNRVLYNITKLSTALYSSRMSKSLFSASSESALLTWHIDTLSRRQPKCEVNSMPRTVCETRTTVQNSSWPGGMSMSQDTEAV